MTIGNKPKNLLLSMMLVFSISPWARGDIPAAFVDIGYGARPMGLGGAYVALASDAYAPIWNPACLPYVRGWQVSSMYAKQFGIVPYYLLSGARSLSEDYGIGGAIFSSGDALLRETTAMVSAGVRLGRFSPTLTNVSAGATLKLRYASFGQNSDGGDNVKGSALGFGLDLALRWKVSTRWTAGLLFRDALNSVEYDNETRNVQYGEAVPRSLILGTAFLAKPYLVFTMDWDKSLYEDTKDKVAVGAEIRLFRIVFLRGGWSQSMDTDPNRKYNWGLGVQYFKRHFGIRFDFAYQVHFLATTPRVSTSIWF